MSVPGRPERVAAEIQAAVRRYLVPARRVVGWCEPRVASA